VVDRWDRGSIKPWRVLARARSSVRDKFDGFDMVMPSQPGRTPPACMRNAIEGGGRSAREVGAINTHGTATIKGDVAEVDAMKEVFDGRLPLSYR
jgi:3-oxoacyl-(acyl-carrier-protein) synthase